MESGVAVVGAGTFGLALAATAARTTENVFLVTRRESVVLAKGVQRVHDFAEVAGRVGLVLLAVPSPVVAEVAQGIAPSMRPEHMIVHGSRGLVGDDLSRVSDIVRRETKCARVGALGGPVLASDLLAGAPCMMVAGSEDEAVRRRMVQTFNMPLLRVYAINDLCGLEWSTAVVGCLSIFVGYAQQIGLNAGIIAGGMTRGVEEMARMVVAAGGHERTAFGLSGYGDLLASISQRERPEILVGGSLARGLTVEEAALSVKQRVEAVSLLPRVIAWAKTRKIWVPLLSALAHGVFRGRNFDDILHDLMTLPVEEVVT